MPNIEFPVIYQNKCFVVDPSQLFDVSQKFRDLITERGEKIQNIQLRIAYNGFSARNIENFLRICQNQQSDAQNSELKEICLIAKMFEADQILNRGITFIQNNMDSNFTIPSDKFDESDGKKYLIIEEILPQKVTIDDLEFDEECEQDHTKIKNNNKKDKSNEKIKKKKSSTVVYEIIFDSPFLKCPRFYMKKDGKVIYMAKQKTTEVFIGSGEDFHISDNKIENTANIARDCKGFNIVRIEDQEFKIKYLRVGENFSLDLSFIQKGNKINWTHKKARNISSFKGEYNHIPIDSKRNMILQNKKNQTEFILRKMTRKSFECECHQTVNPIIAFSIALSQILGPFSLYFE